MFNSRNSKLSRMSLRRKSFSIMIHRITRFILMPLSIKTLSIATPSTTTRSIMTLWITSLSITTFNNKTLQHCSESRYFVCCYTETGHSEWRYIEPGYSVCHYTEWSFSERHYTASRYAACGYAEWMIFFVCLFEECYFLVFSCTCSQIRGTAPNGRCSVFWISKNL